MIIGGLQKLTLIDYPKKLACTVFCAGCNYRCGFCYNPELVLPEKIKEQVCPASGRGRGAISESEFFDFLNKRKGLLNSVCIGGGEPSVHHDLRDFCRKIKDLDYFIKLDTNGSYPQMLKNLIDQKLVDYIALDVKAPPEKYIQAIGMENKMVLGKKQSDFWLKKIVENIEKSINLLKQEQIDSEFRTTIVPGLLKKQDILEIVKWISQPTRLRQGFGGQGKYFLQQFRPEKTINPEFIKIKPYSQKYLLEIQKSVAPFFQTCEIRE